MRKLAITFLILLVLGVAGALLLPYLLDVNSYRGRIQAKLEQRLHRPVTLGPMELKILPLAFRVENVAIAEDTAFGPRKDFAEADELYVTAALWPLLHGDLQVHSLVLNRPRIELARSAEGVWNYSSLGRAPAPPPRPNQPVLATPAAPASASAFSLAEVKITDGQVAIADLQKNSPRTVYDHIDLTLGDYAPGKAFSIVAATRVLQLEHATLVLGQTPIAVKGSIQMQPTPSQLDLSVSTPRVSIEEAARLAAAFGVVFNPSAKIAGNLQAKLRVRGPADHPTYDGSIAADSVVITGKDLPRPVKIKIGRAHV